MKQLTDEEIYQALDDNGESECGDIAVEATIQELADIGASTCCGCIGNKAFKHLSDEGYGYIVCRGWFNQNPRPLSDGTEFGPQVSGMFHIKIHANKTAKKIEKIASRCRGSLRFSGDSLWDGFKEFEIE